MKPLIWILGCWGLLGLLSAQAQTQIVLAGMDDPLSHTSVKVMEEAYGQIGIEVIYVPYPPFRGLKVANQGIVDGEVSRVPNLQKQYTNLRMISVPVNLLEMVLFTRLPDFEFESLDQLKPYTIGIQRGIKIEERFTQGLQSVPVSNASQKFFMLERGRVDFIIESRLLGQARLREFPIENARILDKALIKTDLFHYLHKRNEHLIAPLTQALQRMQALGRITEIRQQMFAKYQ